MIASCGRPNSRTARRARCSLRKAPTCTRNSLNASAGDSGPAGICGDPSGRVASAPEPGSAAPPGASAAGGVSAPAAASLAFGTHSRPDGASAVDAGDLTALGTGPVDSAADGAEAAAGAAGVGSGLVVVVVTVRVGTRHSQRPRSFSWHCQPPLCRANTNTSTLGKRGSPFAKIPILEKFHRLLKAVVPGVRGNGIEWTDPVQCVFRQLSIGDFAVSLPSVRNTTE